MQDSRDVNGTLITYLLPKKKNSLIFSNLVVLIDCFGISPVGRIDKLQGWFITFNEVQLDTNDHHALLELQDKSLSEPTQQKMALIVFYKR